MSEVPTSFGAARATQLRVLLIASVVTGAITALFGAVILAGGHPWAGLALLVPGTLLLAACAVALRALALRGTPAKVACLVVGALQVLLGVLLTASGLGLLPSILGVLLIVLTVLPDASRGTS